MTCEMFIIGSLAGLALTAGALTFQFFNNKKKGQAVVNKEIEKEQRLAAATTTITK